MNTNRVFVIGGLFSSALLVQVSPGGPVGEMAEKPQGTIEIDKTGVVQITAYPKDTSTWWNSFRLKSVKLVPVESR